MNGRLGNLRVEINYHQRRLDFFNQRAKIHQDHLARLNKELAELMMAEEEKDGEDSQEL